MAGGGPLVGAMAIDMDIIPDIATGIMPVAVPDFEPGINMPIGSKTSTMCIVTD